MDIVNIVSITLFVIAVCAFYAVRGRKCVLRVCSGVVAAILLWAFSTMNDYSDLLLNEGITDYDTFNYYRLDTDKLDPEHLTLSDCWNLLVGGKDYVDSCCYLMFNGGHVYVQGSDIDIIHVPWHPYATGPSGTFVGNTEIGYYKVDNKFELSDTNYDIYYSVGSRISHEDFGGVYDIYLEAMIQPAEQ